MIEEILIAVRELSHRIPEDAFPVSQAMRAALAAGASDDVAEAARHIRGMFAQVPDATLLSMTFWDSVVRGIQSSYGKKSPQDLLNEFDRQGVR
jgi:hypothetical protein